MVDVSGELDPSRARLPAGLRVLVTRPAAQAMPWIETLASAGAVPIAYPTIDVMPPPSWEGLDEALGHLNRYAWVLFTSASAVRFALSRLPYPPLLVADGRRIAAVGRETKRALEEAGVAVAIVPSEESGVSLSRALRDLAPGTRVLFPQAVGGRAELRDALAANGCIIDVVPASQTIALADLPPLPDFDVATFASPSALRAFLAVHQIPALIDRPVVVIGPTTLATARALGLKPELAAAPSIDAVVSAIACAIGQPPR